jgi:hypothetical protein
MRKNQNIISPARLFTWTPSSITIEKNHVALRLRSVERFRFAAGIKKFSFPYNELVDNLGYQLTFNTNVASAKDITRSKASFPPLLIFLIIGASVVALLWWTQKRKA